QALFARRVSLLPAKVVGQHHLIEVVAVSSRGKFPGFFGVLRDLRRKQAEGPHFSGGTVTLVVRVTPDPE
ncbi:MAG: hypothetical protein M0P17_05160, partial [Methanoculleus sp.]|nr:hypothetical protein [Methanoculleus sp.]